jgi:hypothetical protein
MYYSWFWVLLRTEYNKFEISVEYSYLHFVTSPFIVNSVRLLILNNKYNCAVNDENFWFKFC